MKFSTALQNKNTKKKVISQVDLEPLEELHEIWYKIQGLNGKFSGRAEKLQQNLISEFHLKSQDILASMEYIFKDWLESHELPGWWDSKYDEVGMKYTLLHGQGKFETQLIYIDITDCVKEELIKILAEDFDSQTEFDDTEFEQDAIEFLAEEGLDTDKLELYDETDARRYIDENNLNHKYHDWAVEKGIFSKEFDDIYGDDWWEQFQDTIENYVIDKCQDEARRQYLNSLPGIENTIELVRESYHRLNNAVSSDSIPTKMNAITLALNTAHHTGEMTDYMGLDADTYEQLSNMDTTEWDEWLSRIAMKCKVGIFVR